MNLLYIAACCAAAVITAASGGAYFGYHSGLHRGRFDAQISSYQRKIDASRAASPRHAATAPRGTTLLADAPRNGVRLPDAPRRCAQAAGHLPAACPDLDTLPLRRLTETGELVAITDRYLQEMRARAAADRTAMAAS